MTFINSIDSEKLHAFFAILPAALFTASFKILTHTLITLYCGFIYDIPLIVATFMPHSENSNVINYLTYTEILILSYYSSSILIFISFILSLGMNRWLDVLVDSISKEDIAAILNDVESLLNNISKPESQTKSERPKSQAPKSESQAKPDVASTKPQNSKPAQPSEVSTKPQNSKPAQPSSDFPPSPSNFPSSQSSVHPLNSSTIMLSSFKPNALAVEADKSLPLQAFTYHSPELQTYEEDLSTIKDYYDKLMTKCVDGYRKPSEHKPENKPKVTDGNIQDLFNERTNTLTMQSKINTRQSRFDNPNTSIVSTDNSSEYHAIPNVNCELQIGGLKLKPDENQEKCDDSKMVELIKELESENEKSEPADDSNKTVESIDSKSENEKLNEEKPKRIPVFDSANMEPLSITDPNEFTPDMTNASQLSRGSSD